MTQSSRMRTLGLLLLASVLLGSRVGEDVTIQGLDLVSERRIDRNIFEFTFRARAENRATIPYEDVRATVGTSDSSTTIVDGSVTFGSMPATAVLTSTDTITIRQDRRVPFSPQRLVWAFTGDPVNAPVDGEEGASPIGVQLNLSSTAFNRVGAELAISFAGGQIATSPGRVSVLRNEERVADAAMIVSSTLIRIPNALLDGKNVFVLYAEDTRGGEVFMEATLWAGTQTATVAVVGPDGSLRPGAIVDAILADDPKVRGQVVATNGTALLANLPRRTILVEARSADDAVGSAALVGGVDAAVTVRIRGLGQPSTIQNNDLSRGTAEGFDTGAAPVQIVPHVE